MEHVLGQLLEFGDMALTRLANHQWWHMPVTIIVNHYTACKRIFQGIAVTAFRSLSLQSPLFLKYNDDYRKLLSFLKDFQEFRAITVQQLKS